MYFEAGGRLEEAERVCVGGGYCGVVISLSSSWEALGSIPRNNQ